VFHKYNRGLKKRNVVLPKGKIDEGENELESAIREVQEETHLKIGKNNIHTDHFIKIETTKNQIVTMYFVEGIEENAVQL
jgi:8-oxo-dGTP pyrophosphatase MutT (NUDIX family)